MKKFNPKTMNFEGYFWSLVDIKDQKKCWKWKGYIEPTGGYGRIKDFRIISNRYGKNTMAHRIAYELVFGPLENLACHECDVRDCCSPYHLFDGTYLENAQDCWEKERHENLIVPSNLGEKNSNTKLTDLMVLDIRNKFEIGTDRKTLAVEFNLSLNTIYKIVNRSTWKHL